MKMRVKKLMTLLTAGMLTMACLTGCGGNSGNDAQQGSTLSGSITLSGSTSMEKLANALKEGFMTSYDGMIVRV